jgi:hypothetical protein
MQFMFMVCIITFHANIQWHCGHQPFLKIFEHTAFHSSRGQFGLGEPCADFFLFFLLPRDCSANKFYLADIGCLPGNYLNRIFPASSGISHHESVAACRYTLQ